MAWGHGSGPRLNTTQTGDTSPTGPESKIKVAVRVRPENKRENAAGFSNIINVMDEHMLVFDPKEEETPEFYHGKARRGRDFLKRANRDMRFAFDHVFGGDVTTHDVYNKTTKGILDGLLDGYNCSVFAYGATGAGKTHTMLGMPQEPGVIFLTMMDLYDRIDQIRDTKTCDIAVSYLEVYNEQIRDLLVIGQFLPVREDPQKGVVVHGLSLHKPRSAEELMHMLEVGNQNRTQHPTDANAESSRSHAVFQVFVRQRDRTASMSTNVRIAKMSLIDLAGSERATVTKNRGARFREGANINRSLLALGNCINALADGKSKGYVPYRNSKLTRLLKDSLGGNCRTVMIAAVSPSSMSYEDTYNTLKYADRAKHIKVGLKRNVVSVDLHISRYPQIVEELKLEVKELKEKVRLYEERGAVLPGKQQSLDLTTERFLVMLDQVFHTRVEIRKELLELEASGRDLAYKMFRRQVTMARITMMSVVEENPTKLLPKAMEGAHRRQENIEKRKGAMQARLDENLAREQVVVAEMKGAGPNGCMNEVLEANLRARHLEIELRDTRRQAKFLKKLCRSQEREAQSSERLIGALLHTVTRQFFLLRANKITSTVEEEEFEAIQKLVFKEDRGVSWADQSMNCGTETLVDTPGKTETDFNLGALLNFPILSGASITPKTPGKNLATPRRSAQRGHRTPQNRRHSARKSPRQGLSLINQNDLLTPVRSGQLSTPVMRSKEGCPVPSGVPLDESVSGQIVGETRVLGLSQSEQNATPTGYGPLRKPALGQQADVADRMGNGLNSTFDIGATDGVFPLQRSPESDQPTAPVILKNCGPSPRPSGSICENTVTLSTNQATVLGNPIPCPVFSHPSQPQHPELSETVTISAPITLGTAPQSPYVPAIYTTPKSLHPPASGGATTQPSATTQALHSGSATVTKAKPEPGTVSTGSETVTKAWPQVNSATVTKPAAPSASRNGPSQQSNQSVVRIMDFEGMSCAKGPLTFADAVRSPLPSVRELQTANLQDTVRSPLAACDNLPRHNLAGPASRRMTVAPGDKGRFEPRHKLFGRSGFTNSTNSAKKAVSCPLPEASLARRHTVTQGRVSQEPKFQLPSVLPRPGYMQMTKAAARRSKNHRRSATLESPHRRKGLVGQAQRVGRDENIPLPQRRGLAGSRSKSVSSFNRQKSTFF